MNEYVTIVALTVALIVSFTGFVGVKEHAERLAQINDALLSDLESCQQSK